MRPWIAAAALVALAALGLAAVPYAVDWDARRTDIEAAAAAVSGHRITIEGPIELTLLPRPTLIAKDVLVASGPKSPVGFELDSKQMDLRLELGPLLVGRSVVQHLRLGRPVLTVHDTDNQPPDAWPPRALTWMDALAPPDLRSVSVSDGRLDYGSDTAEDRTLLSEVSLDVVMTEAGGPIEAVGLFKTRHHRFNISLDVGKTVSDGTSSMKLRVGAQNGVDETTTLDFSGVIERSADDLNLRGKMNLSGPDLRRGLMAVSAATGYPPTFQSIASGQPFNMQGRIAADAHGITSDDMKLQLGEKSGRGAIRLQFDPTASLDMNLDLPGFILSEDANWTDFAPIDLFSSIPALPGQVDIRLREVVYRDQAVRQATLRLVTSPDGNTRIERAKALLPGLTDVRFEGDVKSSATGRVLSGRLTTVADDLGSALHWLDIVPAERGTGWRGLSLESDLEISNVEIALSSIDMRLDSSRLSGAASLRFGERLGIGLDVDVDRLDLDLYPAATEAADLVEKLARQFEDLDGFIDARFERLAWNELRFEEVALDAKANAGHIEIDGLAIRTVGETAMTVQGEIDLGRQGLDLKTEVQSNVPSRVLRHIDLGLPIPIARLEPLQLTGWVKGRMNEFDLSATAGYDGGQWSIEGQSGWIDRKLRYDLAINAEHPDHQRLAGHLGLAPLLPVGDAPGSFEFAGKMHDAPEENWIASGSLRLGPTTITGRLTQERQSPRPGWNAKLSIGNPKKDSLAPFLTLAGLRSTADWTPRMFIGRLPHVGFRTDWLDKLDGSIDLASKGGLAGKGIELTASLDQGFLYIDQFRAAPWNGTVRGELTVEHRDDHPYAAIGLELDGIDAEAVAAWLGLSKVVSGPLSLQLEATSVGRTLYDVMATSTGKMSLEVGPGALKGTFINALRERLVDKPNTNRDPANPANSSIVDQRSIPLLGLKADADLSRGVASINEASLTFEPEQGQRTEAVIDGTVDLLLWIAELEMALANEESGSEESGSEQLIYRIIGPPDRPQSFISSGKR